MVKLAVYSLEGILRGFLLVACQSNLNRRLMPNLMAIYPYEMGIRQIWRKARAV